MPWTSLTQLLNSCCDYSKNNSIPNLNTSCLQAREKGEEAGNNLLRPTDTFDMNNIKRSFKRKSTCVSPPKARLVEGFSLTGGYSTTTNASPKKGAITNL